MRDHVCEVVYFCFSNCFFFHKTIGVGKGVQYLMSGILGVGQFVVYK
jgi:hypothetical protein